MINLQEVLAFEKPAKALDVGSRMGEFTARIKKALPEGSAVIGLDCCQETVNQANQKFADEGIQFVAGQGESIPFEDASFDLVALSNTLHHIKEYEKVLQEMQRVLKPGGILMVNEMFSDDQNPAQITHYLQHSLEAKLDMLTGDYQRPAYQKAEIIAIVDKLKLNQLKSLEFRESQEYDQKLAQKNQKLVAAVEKVKELPEYEQLKKEAQSIVDRCQETGIERGTQLLVWGEK